MWTSKTLRKEDSKENSLIHKYPLEKMKIDDAKIEGTIKVIWDKVFVAVSNVVEQEIVQDKDMNVENLKAKVQSNFFTSASPIRKQHFGKASSFCPLRIVFENW